MRTVKRSVKMPHVKTVRSRGKTYVYFDTGGKKNGKPILLRLPAPGTRDFGQAYANACAARNRRKHVPKAGGMTLPDMIDLYQRSPKYRGHSLNTQRQYGLYLARVGEAFNLFAPDALTRQDIVNLADTMAETPQAANAMVRATAALYVWGRSRGHTTARPCDDVELFTGGSHKEWPQDLIDLALASKDDGLRVPVALMLYTAQRIGDVAKMRWSEIGPDGLRVVQQKTKKQLTIPLHAELRKHLDRTTKRGLFIASRVDGKALGSRVMRETVAAFMADQDRKFVPHGLRKNAVNALLEAGCSVAETAAISGQSLAMVEHYAAGRNQPKLGFAAMQKWELAHAGTNEVRENALENTLVNPIETGSST